MADLQSQDPRFENLYSQSQYVELLNLTSRLERENVEAKWCHSRALWRSGELTTTFNYLKSFKQLFFPENQFWKLRYLFLMGQYHSLRGEQHLAIELTKKS